MWEAAALDDVEVLKSIVGANEEESGINVDELDDEGRGMLHVAAAKG